MNERGPEAPHCEQLFHSRRWGALALLLVLAGCKVGPSYEAPELEMPQHFKESATQPTTQPASQPATQPTPQTAAIMGARWWRVFNDPVLSAMEEYARQQNPTLQAAYERVREEEAITRIAAAGFYPQVNFDPSFSRSRSSANSVRGGGRSRTGNLFDLPLSASYEVDIWGRVSSNFESSQATANAIAEDYGVVLLTLQAQLAQDYFAIRELDSQQEILGRNVDTYRKQISLTQSQLKAGLAAKTDLLQAETLLSSTLAQEIDNQRQRAVLEHAIAILLGRPPSAVTVKPHALDTTPPEIPPGLPVELLHRRPDVSEAEQNLRAAVAQVRVATADFYPRVLLTGSAGFESYNIQKALDWESRVWSFGPSVTFPVFVGGQLKAQLNENQARVRELAATYRETLLGAFRDVEDNLVDIHSYADEYVQQTAAVASAREYVRLAEVQYKQGIVNYLIVIDADRTLLSSELSAAQVLNNRMASTVLLIKAMGGGWEAEKQAAMQPATKESATQPAK